MPELDLSFGSPAHAHLLAAAQQWLKMGVDGFRLDVAHYIMKDPDLRDQPLNPAYGKESNRAYIEYEKFLHVYDKGHPDVHTVFAEFRAILDKFSKERPRYSVGEIHILDWKERSAYYGASNNELHMPFNFALLMSRAYTAEGVRAIVDGLEGALPAGAWPNYVMGNHDEVRFASRVGVALARQVAVLLLTLRGTPTLYQGDELGMTNVDIPQDQVQDPYGIRVPGKGRDGCRTPMQWTPGPNAGFSAPGVQTWLPLAPDYPQKNVEVELQDPASFLNLYRALLAFRRQSMALQAGSYRPVDGTPQGTYVYLREFGSQKLLVALNFIAGEKIVSLPDLGKGVIKISSLMDRAGEVDLARLTLRPFEGLVVEL
jgi:glycosidase